MRHMLCSLLQGIYIDTTDDMCKEMISPVVMYILLAIEKLIRKICKQNVKKNLDNVWFII